jgi:hypothetical protein
MQCKSLPCSASCSFDVSYVQVTLRINSHVEQTCLHGRKAFTPSVHKGSEDETRDTKNEGWGTQLYSLTHITTYVHLWTQYSGCVTVLRMEDGVLR